MSKTEKYKSIVKSICDLYHLLDPNRPIYRAEVGKLWALAEKTSGKSDRPGHQMSEAMEEWGIEIGREFAFDTGPNGKATKVRIEP